MKVIHIKQQKYFHHLKGRGYNTRSLLYPWPLRWWKYFCCFIHVILYQSTEFRPHRRTDCGNMTSYPFVKMAATTTKYRFWSLPFRRNWRVIYIRLPNFVQIGAPIAKIWRHIHFSRWRTLSLNTTSGFVFVDVTAFRSSKSIRKPNFVDITQFMAEI